MTKEIRREEIERARLKDLVQDSANARLHSERNLREIARSLVEFGQHAPLVVQRSTNRILVGNGRYEAMLSLGWEDCLVHYVDDDNVTAVRRALADNRTAELAEWDEDVLSALIRGLGDDIEIPGWSEDELEKLVAAAEEFGAVPDEEPEFDESVAIGIRTVICPECGHEFPAEI